MHTKKYDVNKVVVMKHTSRIVGPRYDPTACDQYELTLKATPFGLRVRSDFATSAHVLVGKHELPLGERLSDKALRLVWSIEERCEELESQRFLAMTDGQFDHDPMDDYCGNYE